MIYREFVKVGDHRIFAEYKEPESDYPTLVLLNGLSDVMFHWDPFIEHLSAPYYGYLRFDFRGQGRTLEAELEKNGGFDSHVTAHEQTNDLKKLLEHFGIETKLHIIGHSYGGGIALDYVSRYPETVKKMILMVPYLIRLDQAYPFQRTMARQLELVRGLGVFPESAFESIQRSYLQFLMHHMEFRYQLQVPDPTARRALIQLTFGIMNFDGFNTFPKLPPHSLHLISVGRDILVPPSLYSEMWDRLPEHTKESWLHIEDGEHLVLEQYPGFCARWAEMILHNDARIAHARKFTGNAYSFEANYGGYHTISLDQEFKRKAEPVF